MNIGDYVRTKYGIGKIIETRIFLEQEEIKLDSNTGKITQVNDNSHWNNKEDIIKSSSNIIDLIEVGDILYLEESDDIACMFFRDIYLVKNEDNLIHIIDDIKNKKSKLISIVTKEQFKSMEYKIGE